MSTILFVAAKGAALALVLVACALLGAWPAGWISMSGARERLVVAAVVGFAVIANVLDLVALCGVFGRASILALCGGGLISLAIGWRHGPWAADLAAARLPQLRTSVVVLALCALALGPLLVLACYPPLEFDETLYHLPFARAFARSGHLPFLPELRVPVFPPLAELLFAAMLLLSDDVSSHLISLAAVILTAALLFVWGEREPTGRRGALAAALYLGSPIVTHLAGTGYVEPSLALLGAATVFASTRYAEEGEPLWLVFGALFAATAAGTKYFGLFFVGAAPALIWLLLARGRGMRLSDVAWFSIVAGTMLAPVYGRIFALTGNPLFPFLPSLFGSTPWDPVKFPNVAGNGWIVSALLLPWRAVFQRSLVGEHPPLSPFVLLCALLLPLALRASRRDRLLSVVCCAFAIAVPADARYQVAILPVACFVLAGALDCAWEKMAPREVSRSGARVAVACMLLFFPGWAYAVWAAGQRGAPPADPATRHEFLARRLATYPAIQELNRTLGSAFTVYAVHDENMVYWADGTLLGDFTGPASFARVIPLAEDPPRFVEALRRLGVTHLLVKKADPGLSTTARASLPIWFRKIYEDEATEVFELRDPATRGTHG